MMMKKTTDSLENCPWPAWRFRPALAAQIVVVGVFGVLGAITIAALVFQWFRDDDRRSLSFAVFLAPLYIWAIARVLIPRVDFTRTHVERRDIFGRVSRIEYRNIEKITRVPSQLCLSGKNIRRMVISPAFGSLERMTELIRERHPDAESIEIVVDLPVHVQQLDINR